jgi:quercetin dioxygenase-like cupin family protein
MPDIDFATFERRALAAGFDSVLERHWAPHAEVPLHSHDFDADALVIEGRLWLSADGLTRELGLGDTFTLARGTPHAERYGPEGATFWVARRSS